MVLKPQDLLFLLKLVAIDGRAWSYSELALELGMSPAEVHAAGKRSVAAQLASRRNGIIVPDIRSLDEFVRHGARYVFMPETGEITRGMPTLHAAPPLSEHLDSSSEPPPVWPDENGEMRGMAFAPLYRSAPSAAQQDKNLYELLVLLDGIRGGRARERALSIQEMKRRLERYGRGE